MDHMTSSISMDEEQSHMTERILNLIVEIIYLLTGENFPLLKSGDHMTITVPPCDSLKLEGHNMQKILDVTKKMTELLTGEVPIRHQDVAVYFSMEEWVYVEGHKDLYKDVLMENQLPLTSPDGSSNRNPPERCPRPLYSQDSTQEDLTIPHHDQNGNFGDCDIFVKEEFKKEDEEYGSMKQLSEGHKDLYKDIMIQPLSNRNPPERCPHPLYSQNSTQEDLTIPRHDQGEDLINIKAEDKLEETYVRDDQRYTEEAGMMRTSIEEETPTEISSGPAIEKPSKDGLTLSPDSRVEDEDITRDCAGENAMGDTHSVDQPSNPPDSEQPNSAMDDAGIQGEKKYSCPECGENFSSELSFTVHERSHTGEKLHSCSECGKSFLHKSALVIHNRSHMGEKPYSCPECGKYFSQKSNLSRHQRLHMGEKPYACSECGKCFPRKSDLIVHQRSHTGERPYSCSECGKCFSQKSHLNTHQRLHTDDKLHSCSECGKLFLQRTYLFRHQKLHLGEKPFSCSECGKCYTRKSELVLHQKIHTEDGPYSCSVCGKRFAQKSLLKKHQRSHAGEKPHFCLECGKRFPRKSDLIVHQRSHTGEKPYSCPECEKSFSKKSDLNTHRRLHTGEKPYSCPECGKCFSRKSHLTEHQICHTRQKQFPCPECGKCYLRKSDLVKHQRSHTGEKL